ncbi:MAG: NAD(P)/FAD-dependent oxidoreductase [Spirochaetia bacterium]
MQGDHPTPIGGRLRVAVVGAGISGLTAANELAAAGIEVTIFERGRGPGGRAGRRQVPGFEFDHGAQYFTVRSDAFARQTAAWIAAGVAAEWSPRFATAGDGVLRPKASHTTRYVGVPGMSGLAGSLAGSLDLRYRTQVISATRQSTTDITNIHSAQSARNRPAEWMLRFSSENQDSSTADTKLARNHEQSDTFDALLLACTPQQGLPLLTTTHGEIGRAERLVSTEPSFAEQARAVKFDPVWAVLLGFTSPPELPADAIFIDHPALSWAARNDSKPGRAGDTAWVLHATGAWSTGREEAAPDSIASALIPAFEEAVGIHVPEPVYVAAHRWRYARPRNPSEETALWDAKMKLGMCGDWCAGARIEGAFTSGLAAAQRILDSEGGLW